MSKNCSRALQIILQNVISSYQSSKKNLHYDKIILNSKNKMKTIWNIIKSETGKEVSKGGAHLLNMNGNLTKNQQKIANPFNN